MSRRNINEVNHDNEPISMISDKKDYKQEVSEIGVFSLFFSDSLVEERWNRAHIKRHLAITTRFLFIAALFQGLFFWSDIIERQNHLFHLGIIRLMLGGFCLLGCFLVASGLLVPSQASVLIINLCYGLPSMAIFYLTRKTFSHWHSLYLVYGMCFFILPKISPLNFMYAFAGSSLFTLSFILISALRLSLQQWLLSNSLLLIVIALFCYDSYSSERLSRERWLLRDRLQREKINLKIVASSIQDDLSKSSESKPYLSTDQMNSMVLKFARKAIVNTSDKAERSSVENVEDQTKRFVHFFKGIIAWALCYAFGYSFDFISLPLSSMHPREMNSSAAFALLMHSMGFSIFLLYFTGQIRWLALNGIVSLLIMIVFNQSGMSEKWVIFSTHSLGYVLLAVVILIMILVFGGVVLVWHHLVNFVKDVLARYPQVKDELGHNKLLESVLVRYIADMPSTNLFNVNNPHKLIIEYGDEESFRSIPLTDMQQHEPAPKKRELQPRRPGMCYFCLKKQSTVLVPACSGWETNTEKAAGISLCTPYTDMVLSREAMEMEVRVAKKYADLCASNLAEMEKTVNEAVARADESLRHERAMATYLKQKQYEIELIVQKLVKQCDKRVADEKLSFENKLQNVISQHNSQLTDLKKLHKIALQRQLIISSSISHLEGTIVEPPQSVVVSNLKSTGAVSPDVKVKKSSQVDEKEKRAHSSTLGVSSLTVIPPKRHSGDGVSSGGEFKGSSDVSSTYFASNESLESVDLFKRHLEACQVEQDEFDRLWKKSLEEIQDLVANAFSRMLLQESSQELSPPHLSSEGNSRMKYALSFLEESEGK